MEQENRIVTLIDMDCFYCQVEEKLNPELKGEPIAVVQYNRWKGGGIIAVNYEARAMGVTRHLRGDEAKEKCPDIQLCSVPCQRGKADISKYRDAGKEVARVLQKFTPLLERASIDEAYLDITAAVQKRLQNLNINKIMSEMMPNTFALGYDTFEQFVSDVHNFGSDCIDFDLEHSRQLLIGALIVSEIRVAVYEETGYRCSAGLAHNKVLAKLVCGMNKPNKQTVLPKHSVNVLYKTLSIKKVKHLGGKFGDHILETLKIKTMGELQHYSEKELQSRFDEKNGLWLYNIARGIDLEPVQARFNPKSIGCCKQFKGKSALLDVNSVKKWLKDLGEEIEDRLEKDSVENNRTPKQMVVSFSMQMPDGRDTSSSRSYNFANEYDLCSELIWNKAFEILMESAEGCKAKDENVNRRLKAPIKFLGISVGKFEDHSENKNTKKIKDYFSAGPSKGMSKSDESVKQIDNYVNESKKEEDKEYIFDNILKSDSNTNELTQKQVKPHSNENKIESSLGKQESFFTKYLNGGLMRNETKSISKTGVKNTGNIDMEPELETNQKTTPSNVVLCGDDSNDTVTSGSTINEEIDKSIALFEDDPLEVTRVSQLREILKNNIQEVAEEDVSMSENDQPETAECHVRSEIVEREANTLESISCSECGKTISLHMLVEHADYHLALKLRDEERQRVRKERDKCKSVVKENNKDTKKKNKEEPKHDQMPSISSFFVKFDDTTPTKMCEECSKKVHMDKFSEHLDFHKAQKLSRELNNRNVNTCPSSSVKRKKKPMSPAKKPKVPCKSIDQFFRQ